MAAAFTAIGAEVAFPFGGQAVWDMVVYDYEDRSWTRVQVKTVHSMKEDELPFVSCLKGNGKPYTTGEIDMIVAVHPETGTLWRFSPGGQRRVHLRPELLWRGMVKPSSLPASGVVDPVTIWSKGERFRMPMAGKLARKRTATKEKLPITCPEDISVETWQMLGRWCEGEGYKAISVTYGITPGRVRERIVRALFRMKIQELPPGYASRRIKAMTVTTSVDPAQGTLLQ